MIQLDKWASGQLNSVQQEWINQSWCLANQWFLQEQFDGYERTFYCPKFQRLCVFIYWLFMNRCPSPANWFSSVQNQNRGEWRVGGEGGGGVCNIWKKQRHLVVTFRCSVFCSQSLSRACQWTVVAYEHKPGHLAYLLLLHWFIRGHQRSH